MTHCIAIDDGGNLKHFDLVEYLGESQCWYSSMLYFGLLWEADKQRCI